MKIVSIGAGNVATHLSEALQNAGFEIVQIYSRTEASAKELAGSLQVPYTIDINYIVDNASLYIISVNDDAIVPLIERMPLTGRLVAHTAGGVSMDVFAGKAENYGVLYPLQTFSKSRPVNFSSVPVFVEANTPGNLQQLRMVAEAISHKVYCASSAERLRLHLAAVFGCNFVNHLYHLSAQIALQAGFDFEALSPLILETACKAIASENPQNVQTGPAARGDCGVMHQHMELLAACPEWKDIYVILSESIRKVTGKE